MSWLMSGTGTVPFPDCNCILGCISQSPGFMGSAAHAEMLAIAPAAMNILVTRFIN